MVAKPRNPESLNEYTDMRVPSAKRLMEAFRDLDKKNANLIRAFAHAVDDPDKLMELVERVPQTEKYVRQLHSSPYRSAMWRRTVALHAIDVLVDGHGVEAIPEEDEDLRRGPRYEYINLGDTYATTLIYDSAKDNLFLGSWGDVVERRGNPEPKSDGPKSSVTLPKKIGESVTVTAHGKNLTIKKNSKDSFFLRIDGEKRTRWGNRAEASEDVSYFLETGYLPRETGASWNPSSIKKKGRIPINPTRTFEHLRQGMIVQVPTVRYTDDIDEVEETIIEAGTYVLMQDPDTDPDNIGDRDWEAHLVEYDPRTGEIGQYWQTHDQAFYLQSTPFKVLGHMDAAELHSIQKKLEKRWAKAAKDNPGIDVNQLSAEDLRTLIDDSAATGDFQSLRRAAKTVPSDADHLEDRSEAQLRDYYVRKALRSGAMGIGARLKGSIARASMWERETDDAIRQIEYIDEGEMLVTNPETRRIKKSLLR